MNTLLIRHSPEDGASKFTLLCADGRCAPAAEIVPPEQTPVEGRPDSNLSKELQWYLEQFLEYPFPPVTDRAQHVLDALKQWGEQAFSALIADRMAAIEYDRAKQNGQEKLLLRLLSNDPGVLQWPWEALCDPMFGYLATACHIERRLDMLAPVAEQAPASAGGTINILLVTARPSDHDVRYRSVSRPLVELIEERELPAKVHVLRPPTFQELRDHLAERPNHYHILHFDGHGCFSQVAHGAGGCHQFQGREGHLVFETLDGATDPISAEQLSHTLLDHAVPMVVLNACQSGMLGNDVEDPFASVAASLLRCGVKSVVAMAYSLYVSGAQEFLPAFYADLFKTGSVAEAVRSGRKQMFAQPDRVCARGRFGLSDWLVPVLYQQGDVSLSFTGSGKTAEARAAQVDVGEADDPHGFIGRDAELLQLERSVRQETPAVLVQGLGGVGKTTLARGFVKWLAVTDGVGAGTMWFTFDQIRSAEYVINRIGEGVLGPKFSLLDMDQRVQVLGQVLKDNKLIIVWDNFEVVAGNPEAGIDPTLTSEDRNLLHALLREMRGGESKVIITSRSDESWLGIERQRLSIGGLRGEEQWEYCDRILRGLGVEIDRTDEDLVELMDSLGGHPLAMRVVLPRLESMRARQVIDALRAGGQHGESADDAQAKLHATLDFAESALPESLKALLFPLGLHERYVDVDYLRTMTEQVNEDLAGSVGRFAEALETAGLLRAMGQNIYEIHPVLTSHLRSGVISAQPEEARNDWTRAFVDLMGSLANRYAPRELHEQRGVFQVHGENFRTALREVQSLGLHAEFGALTQSLAAYAQNTRHFVEARRLYGDLAENATQAGRQDWEAAAYHQLGIVAMEQRDYAEAGKWYRKSLAIKEKPGNERGAASTYHQLGRLAQERRDFAKAEKWYRKALEMEEKHGDEHGAAIIYHQLGMTAQLRRDYAEAEKWYRKSLAIKEKQGNEHGAAGTYHQLGSIAQEQRDFAEAEKWYRKSLEIEEKHGNEYGAAITYHQLGNTAQLQCAYAEAEEWYRKSLAIKEKQGNEHGASSTYHQLGVGAQEQRDFAEAEKWYRKSLEIEERNGNEYGAAITYHQLGRVAQEQREYAEAKKWYRKSLEIKEKQGNEHGAASTYHQLGVVAEERKEYAESVACYTRAMDVFVGSGSEHNAGIVMRSFVRTISAAPAELAEELQRRWREAGLPLPPGSD